jgi:hypothetical protein
MTYNIPRVFRVATVESKVHNSTKQGGNCVDHGHGSEDTNSSQGAYEIDE